MIRTTCCPESEFQRGQRLPALLDEIRLGAGDNPLIDRGVAELEAELTNRESLERRARVIVEKMALLLQASLLNRHAPAPIADAFAAARLAEPGHVFGTLPTQIETAPIIERAAAALEVS